MKRYKLIHDNTLSPIQDPGELGAGVEARPLAVIGWYSPDGKIVGVELPISDAAFIDEPASGMSERPVTPQERAASEEAYREWRAKHPPLEFPIRDAKPFDPMKIPDLGLSEAEAEAFIQTLESYRQPQPWVSPWDLP